MSIRSAEGHLGMLASFVSAHEKLIGGKLTDPELVREDYKEVDPNDLEEMDLNWKLAMLTLRVQRFTDRTGRKVIDGKVGLIKPR